MPQGRADSKSLELPSSSHALPGYVAVTPISITQIGTAGRRSAHLFRVIEQPLVNIAVAGAQIVGRVPDVVLAVHDVGEHCVADVAVWGR